jgi:hypothetical protein
MIYRPSLLLKKKEDNVLPVYLEFNHHCGGWKIRLGVFLPKNPVF